MPGMAASTDPAAILHDPYGGILLPADPQQLQVQMAAAQAFLAQAVHVQAENQRQEAIAQSEQARVAQAAAVAASAALTQAGLSDAAVSGGAGPPSSAVLSADRAADYALALLALPDVPDGHDGSSWADLTAEHIANGSAASSSFAAAPSTREAWEHHEPARPSHRGERRGGSPSSASAGLRHVDRSRSNSEHDTGDEDYPDDYRDGDPDGDDGSGTFRAGQGMPNVSHSEL